MRAIIQKSAVPDSKAFVVKRLEEQHFDPTLHLHPEYQIFLVLEGMGTRIIGDSIKPFKAGDLVFTGPDLPHLWKNDESYFSKVNQTKSSGIVIYFPQNFLGDVISSKVEMENIRYLFAKAARGLDICGKTNLLVSGMMEELLLTEGVDSIVLLLKILNTIAKSQEAYPITHVDYVPVNNKTETDRMNKVYQYVMENFRHKVSLESVSELLSMTPTSFSRYFKSRVNRSFSEFLKEVRIHYALNLLKENKVSINHVSYESGYSTLSNFNKHFREVTGKTPLNYRKEYLKVRDGKIA